MFTVPADDSGKRHGPGDHGFHANYNKQDIKAIYDSGDPMMSQKAELAKFTSILVKIFGRMGKSKESRETARRNTTYEGRPVIVVEHTTAFEGGLGTETFTMFVDAGRATLAGTTSMLRASKAFFNDARDATDTSTDPADRASTTKPAYRQLLFTA